jgi:N-acetylglucosamine malate deacetylase 1
MKILAVGAHPDDIEFGMCGTLIKLVDEGHSVAGLVLTKGEAGTHGTAELREAEMKKAAAVVGYTLEMLDFRDTKIVDTPEAREIVANVVRKHKPDIVFVPYHTNFASHKDGMAHPDHTTAGHLVRHALRIAKFKSVKMEYPEHFVSHLVYYMVPRNKQPTLVNDVSKYADKIMLAMRAHESQISGPWAERLLMFRKMYGMMIGVELGEAFLVEDPLKFDAAIFK